MKAGNRGFNMSLHKQRVIAIIGPTASGKTEFSLKLAEKLNTLSGKTIEIISADSRQVYKHMPVTTAQPSADQMKMFKHHFVNQIEPEQEFNAGMFGTQGRKLVNNIFKKGGIPVIAGGSGLYINSLIYGLFEYDESITGEKQKIIRNELYGKLEADGQDALINELRETDPDTFNSMTHITERRLIRALEVYYATGIPLSVHKKNNAAVEFETLLIGIKTGREELYKRINSRTDQMISGGMIEEIKSLKEKGYHYKTHNSLNTVGAKEVFDFLDGLISPERMTELIKQNTRRFAKRQLTWFNRDKNTRWAEILKDEKKIIDSIVTGYQTKILSQ